MNSGEFNLNVINKLLDLTVSEEIKWSRIPNYLDGYKNESLRRYLIGSHQYFYSRKNDYYWPMLLEYDSYCVEINGGLLIIFAYQQKDLKIIYEIALQTVLDRPVEKMTGSDSYQRELEDLWKSAKAGGKSSDSFLNDILKL